MNDENAGLGGSYLLDPETGKRALVERTEPVAPAEKHTDKPADAGFFSPADPVDPIVKE